MLTVTKNVIHLVADICNDLSLIERVEHTSSTSVVDINSIGKHIVLQEKGRTNSLSFNTIRFLKLLSGVILPYCGII